MFNYFDDPNKPNVIHQGKVGPNLGMGLAALQNNAQLEKENQKVVSGFKLMTKHAW